MNEEHISPDGQWRWDGTQWVPNQQSAPVATSTMPRWMQVALGGVAAVMWAAFLFGGLLGAVEDEAGAKSSLPEQQRQFLDLVTDGEADFKRADGNEVAAKDALIERNAALVSMMGNPSTFTDWRVTVEEISESSGKAGLSVSFDGIELTTWSTTLFGDDGTMVEPDAPCSTC